MRKIFNPFQLRWRAWLILTQCFRYFLKRNLSRFHPVLRRRCGSGCLLSDAAHLHHWLSVTIHFNRHDLHFDKYTEYRNKCKPLRFIALHIRVVPPLFSPFVECPISDTRYWMIGHFRYCVTERLLNIKVVVFLGFLCVAIVFCVKICDWPE